MTLQEVINALLSALATGLLIGGLIAALPSGRG